MGEKTDIDWADRTFNGWIGCTKISPACDNCYAAVATPSRTLGVEWGAGKPRYRTSAANWKLPLRWNSRSFFECPKCLMRGDAAAFKKEHGTFQIGDDVMGCAGMPEPTRQRVFSASLADWLDNEVPAEWLADLLNLIRLTPNLDWLLLTKRIGNWRTRLELALATIHDSGQRVAMREWIQGWLAGKAPTNVWIGATICNQAEADRDVLKLLRVPAAVRFVSIEPMLGPVDLERVHVLHNAPFDALRSRNPKGYKRCVEHAEGYCFGDCEWRVPALDLVITGGESGKHARPPNPKWFRDIRDQCAAAGTALLHKQNGEWVSVSEVEGPGEHYTFPDGSTVRRIGKLAAGRMLDGKIHHEFPEVRHG